MSVQVEGYRGENFEVLEAAVMETARGRWFLEEFARRQRAKETLAILASLHKLEKALLATPPNPSLLQKPNTQTPESLKFFSDDEDLFEPALLKSPSAVPGAAPPKSAAEHKGAKLHIHHNPVAPLTAASSSALALEDTPQNPEFVATPDTNLRFEPTPPATEEKPKQRVVIIRKQLDDDVSIPMLDDKTPSEHAAPPIG